MTNSCDIKLSFGLEIGIIGTNFISDTFCEALKILGITPAAVYSRAKETGESFAAKHGIKNVFCDFDAFCSSDKINSAYVASPNFCHSSQTLSLLEHGKHVLCEKPAAVNSYEFAKMRKLASSRGLILMEAMRPVHDTAFNVIKKLLPQCGKLRFCHFEYSQYSSRYDRFKNGIMTNAFDPTLSNAAVMDIGVYPLHMCVYLFGRPESVISRSVKLPNGFEGQGNVILGYGDMTAEIAYSKITEASLPSFIRGEDAEISFGHALSKINEIALTKRDGTKIPTEFSPVGNNMIFEIRDFCDCIAGKISPEGFLDATENTIYVMDEVRKQNGIEFPADKVIF
ncbi:MAG: Gfo/Idh/MocA family oxidoreductase [Clostridia bacterium]|nr:Gfo/Idh/MocA family oxidoreductase [Clostridia bacterium]